MKYMFTHGPHSYTEVLPVTSVVHSKCSVEKVLPRDVLVSQGAGGDSPNYGNIAAAVLTPLLTDSVQPIIEVVDLCAKSPAPPDLFDDKHDMSKGVEAGVYLRPDAESKFEVMPPAVVTIGSIKSMEKIESSTNNLVIVDSSCGVTGRTTVELGKLTEFPSSISKCLSDVPVTGKEDIQCYKSGGIATQAVHELPLAAEVSIVSVDTTSGMCTSDASKLSACTVATLVPENGTIAPEQEVLYNALVNDTSNSGVSQESSAPFNDHCISDVPEIGTCTRDTRLGLVTSEQEESDAIVDTYIGKVSQDSDASHFAYGTCINDAIDIGGAGTRDVPEANWVADLSSGNDTGMVPVITFKEVAKCTSVTTEIAEKYCSQDTSIKVLPGETSAPDALLEIYTSAPATGFVYPTKMAHESLSLQFYDAEGCNNVLCDKGILYISEEPSVRIEDLHAPVIVHEASTRSSIYEFCVSVRTAPVRRVLYNHDADSFFDKYDDPSGRTGDKQQVFNSNLEEFWRKLQKTAFEYSEISDIVKVELWISYCDIIMMS